MSGKPLQSDLDAILAKAEELFPAKRSDALVELWKRETEAQHAYLLRRHPVADEVIAVAAGDEVYERLRKAFEASRTIPKNDFDALVEAAALAHAQGDTPREGGFIAGANWLYDVLERMSK